MKEVIAKKNTIGMLLILPGVLGGFLITGLLAYIFFLTKFPPLIIIIALVLLYSIVHLVFFIILIIQNDYLIKYNNEGLFLSLVNKKEQFISYKEIETIEKGTVFGLIAFSDNLFSKIVICTKDKKYSVFNVEDFNIALQVLKNLVDEKKGE